MVRRKPARPLGLASTVTPGAHAPVVLLVGASHWPSTLVLAYRLHQAGLRPVMIDPDTDPPPLPFARSEPRPAQQAPAPTSALNRWRGHPDLRLVLPLTEDWMPACSEVFAGTGVLMHEACTVPLSVLLSKSAMLEQARQAGLCVPRSVLLRDARHALEVAQAWGLPVMLKGDRGQGGSQVRRCDHAQQIAAAYSTLAERSPVSLQAALDGSVWGAGAFFDGGRLLRVHIYERLPSPGSAEHGPPERIRHQLEPAALDGLSRLGQHLNWSGFGQIDFIRRPDGSMCFLEFNPRLWGSIAGADAAGNDLIGALVQRLRGHALDVDLNNRDGWSGLIYPKRVHRLAREGRLLALLRLFLNGEHRRSRPMHSWSPELERFVLKGAYWSWHNGGQRKGRARGL